MSISLDPPLDTDLDTADAGCEALDTAVLVAIAAGLAEVPSPRDLRPGESPDERHYERILATPTYDAWLIHWPPGTGLDLHDHGESAGAFAVVAGQLDETTIRNGRQVVRRLLKGCHARFPAAQVHAVRNASARPATSVHVYSPPLEAMTYYAADLDGSLSAVRRDAGNWEPGA